MNTADERSKFKQQRARMHLRPARSLHVGQPRPTERNITRCNPIIEQPHAPILYSQSRPSVRRCLEERQLAIVPALDGQSWRVPHLLGTGTLEARDLYSHLSPSALHSISCMQSSANSALPSHAVV